MVTQTPKSTHPTLLQEIFQEMFIQLESNPDFNEAVLENLKLLVENNELTKVQSIQHVITMTGVNDETA